MIKNFLWSMAEQNPNLWFQQYRATAHTARQTFSLFIVIHIDIGIGWHRKCKKEEQV